MDFELKPLCCEQDENRFKSEWDAYLQNIEDTWKTSTKDKKLVNLYMLFFNKMVIPMYKMTCDGLMPKDIWTHAISTLHKKLVKSKPLYNKVTCYKARLDYSLDIKSKELLDLKALFSTNTPLPQSKYGNIFETWAYFNLLSLRNFPLSKASGLGTTTAVRLTSVVPPDITGLVDYIKPLPGLIAGLDTAYFKNAMGEESYLNYIFDYERYKNLTMSRRSFAYVPLKQANDDLHTWLKSYALDDSNRLNIFFYCLMPNNRISETLKDSITIEKDLLPYIETPNIKNMLKTCVSLQITDVDQIKEMFLCQSQEALMPLPDLSN